jgi:hypothetical protein
MSDALFVGRCVLPAPWLVGSSSGTISLWVRQWITKCQTFSDVLTSWSDAMGALDAMSTRHHRARPAHPIAESANVLERRDHAIPIGRVRLQFCDSQSAPQGIQQTNVYLTTDCRNDGRVYERSTYRICVRLVPYLHGAAS